MKSRHVLAISLLSFAGPWLPAQEAVRDSGNQSLMQAFGDLNHGPLVKPNEVTVVLPPPDAPIEAPKALPADPTLVGPDEKTAETPPKDAAAAPIVGDEPATDPKPGFAVRVERLQSGSGEIDPAQVKLLAPFPAKPLAQAPEGWRMETPGKTPPMTREVELSAGKKITLSIRPHLLVVEADGTQVFQVNEPGYNAALGYQQDATIGAILSNSIRELEDDSKRLGMAIDQLEQLLVSLPRQEEEPATQPESRKKR
jgi:hypothetical protein